MRWKKRERREKVGIERERREREEKERRERKMERETRPVAAVEDKMCGEVMALMNSLWLISRSQVGV